MGITQALVVSLVEGLENKGHHLYCDNYYTSPDLFLTLRSLGFGACGTVRVNRRGVPASIKAKDKMTMGEVKSVNTGGVLALKWKDKRVVTILSTIHDDSTIIKRRRTRLSSTGVEEVTKPKAIVDYNTYMGGVDKSDQLLSYYTFQHRTSKWWKRAALHLINLAYVNAFIIYKSTPSNGRKLTHEMFLVKVARGLLLQAGVAEADLESIETMSTRPAESYPEPLRLTGRHFAEQLPPCSSGRVRQCVCAVCSDKKGRKKVTTTIRCKICKVALCNIPCFELYHTKVNPIRHLPTLS